ncbi:MAG: hypothetical protein NZ556_06610, partial [Fimbriimonadales bacterium]|nr:hypothetical protein [Fimbriimonadales bacterium]
GWLWSEVLGAWLGTWEGEYRRHFFNWLRLYHADGTLVPTDEEEKVQVRRQAAEAQAEIERLRARLRALGVEE